MASRRFSEAEVREIRERDRLRQLARQIWAENTTRRMAAEYGVAVRTVCNICSGITYRWVEMSPGEAKLLEHNLPQPDPNCRACRLFGGLCTVHGSKEGREEHGWKRIYG